MSTPSPLPSPGTFDGAASPKSRIRITVLTILALHVVVIGGLLLQGCDKGGKPAAGAASNTVSSLPPLVPDTNYFGSFPNPGDPGAGAAASAAGTPVGGAPAPGAAAAAAAAVPGASAFQDPTVFGGGTGTPGAVPGAGTAGAGFGAAAPSTASTLPPITSSAVPGLSAPPAAGTEYVIRKGDTIGALAKRFGVTEQAIIEANPQAKPRNLKIDEKLSIPAPVPAAAGAGARGSTASAVPAAGEGEIYVVKAGDTLTKVAKKFGVTVKQLRAANNLKGDRIVPKQRLTIPAKAAAAAAPAAGSAAAPAF